VAGETQGEREKTVRGTYGGKGIGPWEQAGLWARGPVKVESGPTSLSKKRPSAETTKMTTV
jgi:hypothetical protein